LFANIRASREAPPALRYAVVSAFCALLNNVLLVGLVAGGVHYLLVACINLFVISITGFLLQAYIVFREPPTKKGFARYFAAMVANQLLWIASLHLLYDLMKIPMAVSGPTATVFFFIWNYVVTRWALRRNDADAETFRESSAATASANSDRKTAVRRVAFVSDAVMPWNKGGKEMMLLQFSTRLKRPDQEVHIYTMNWWNGPASVELDGVHYHALCKLYPLYVGEKRSTLSAVMFALAVFKLLFRRFDALHVDQMPFFPLYSARLVAWLKRQRMTATWHEVWGRDYWMKYMGGLGGMAGALIEKVSFHLPDAIVSDSALTTQRLLANGVRCRVETLQLGVDVKAIGAIAPAEYDSDVIFVGRLLPHKGVEMLLEALAIVKATRPDIRAVIVGTGSERARLEEKAHALGLAANVSLLGEIEDHNRVFALMKASKLLALPSNREGFGLVVLEANAAGLPVVTLRHPDNAARELIREGVNGYLAEPNANDLADKLVKTLNARADLQPMADIGAYDWSNVVRRLDRFLIEAGA